jgi:creatinine amidohydrolase/Fe(II)-dependent formamide hydrolase-like protein
VAAYAAQVSYPGPYLSGVAWPEIPDGPLVVVPLGSVEQHGHHLPLSTDTSVACAAAEAAMSAFPGALLAPSLAYGASGEHEGFPGTISIGTDALTALLVEYGRSAARWAGRLLFVNGHGGNLDALRAAVPLLRSEGRDVAWFPCGVEPEAVRAGSAVAGVTTPIGRLLPQLRAEGVLGVSPTGVLGDPAGASAEEGAALMAELVDRLMVAGRSWRVDPAGRLVG